MMQTEITNSAPEIKKTPTARGYYSAIMGMNGVLEENGESRKFKGSMSVTWSNECYVKSASKMLMEDYTELNDEIRDAGAEVVNIIMGKAKTILAERGYKIDMSTPTVVIGQDHELQYQKDVMTITTPFTSELGDFWLEIGYQDA
jgi:chemotaxis protein CheX